MDTWAVVPLYEYNDMYMEKSNVSGDYANLFGMKYLHVHNKESRDDAKRTFGRIRSPCMG